MRKIKLRSLLMIAGAVGALIPFTGARAEKVEIPNEIVAATPKESDEREKTFNAESFMLDNGMQVIVVPNNRAPVITQMVWYKVGAAQEPQGKSGIAHFLEHLMFKGSKQVGGEPLAPGEFSKIVRSIGGQDNAFTSQDYTAYFQSVPADKLEQVMRMEAGRMRGMILPENEVLSERNVVMEERRMRTDNNPQSKFFEQLEARAFHDHPYGVPVIGWMDEIEKLNRADAKAFYERWYAPENAVLVVTGDVTPAEVFAKAIDIYGTLPNVSVPQKTYEGRSGFEPQERLVMSDPAVREPMIYKLYRVPSAVQDKQSALALEVLAEILGGGPASRLYQSLVTKQKLASSAGLHYDSLRAQDASFALSAVPLPGKSMEKLEKAFMRELELLVEKGVSEQELDEAITRLQDSAVYARDSLSGPAMIIGRALAIGLDLDDVEYWPDDIASVTREQVMDAAHNYLNPKTTVPVTGILRPETEDERKTREAAAASKELEAKKDAGEIAETPEEAPAPDAASPAESVEPDEATEITGDEKAADESTGTVEDTIKETMEDGEVQQ